MFRLPKASSSTIRTTTRSKRSPRKSPRTPIRSYSKYVPKKDYSSLNEKIENDEELSVSEIEDLQSTNVLLEQSVPDQWSQCDTVYIGFPVQSITAAPAPVSVFLSQNNLKNKTFIPFTIGTQDALDHAKDSLTFDGARKGWESGKAFSPTYTDAEVKKWVETVNQQ